MNKIIVKNEQDGNSFYSALDSVNKALKSINNAPLVAQKNVIQTFVVSPKIFCLIWRFEQNKVSFEYRD